jgi:endonuclease YncB( thermonuclease family)
MLGACTQSVQVADGETIIVGATHYRLWGIEAPDLHQTCIEEWPAGLEARRLLEQLIGTRPIVCEERGLDPYRRTLAVCRVDGVDLGATMVDAGMAWAAETSTRAYVGVEREARERGRGIHAFSCRPAATDP